MPRYTLIGNELSLYTGKARTYMRWKGIPFNMMLPSEEIFKTIILPHAGIAMIPVLLIHDDDSNPQRFRTIQDTKEIMDFFEETYVPGARIIDLLPTLMQHSIIPRDPNHAFAAHLFELVADEWLVTQAMYWRWYRPHLAKQRTFLATEFGNARGGVNPLKDQLAIGEKAMQRFAGFTPGLGVSDKTSPALEWQFRELLRLMQRHFDDFPFLLGNTISVADFAFWGPFGPHLGRDPVPSYIIKTEAPAVWEWIERVDGGYRWAGHRMASGHESNATYGTSKPHAPRLEETEVPKTSTDILKFLLEDYAPMLLMTVDRTIQYIEQKGGRRTTLPRSLGEDDYTLAFDSEKVKGTRRISTHAVWELDRMLARSLSNSTQQEKQMLWLKSACGDGIAGTFRQAVERWVGTRRHIEREKGKLVAVAPSGTEARL
ncbi:hypothetical protein MBLNU457_3866t1 [Dothideomycetes sp. NU457]